MLRDREGVIKKIEAEAGLTRSEASLYLDILEKGSLSSLSKGPELEKLEAGGMVIRSGDGSCFIPTHPRLGISNHYRTWREQMVREINQRRMRVDSLILELIPVYEAATEKRQARGGG